MMGINEKYLKEAKEKKLGIVFLHGEDEMTLQYGTIAGKIVAKSEKPFRDRYNKTPPYYLYYFQWKPDLKMQESLFTVNQ